MQPQPAVKRIDHVFLQSSRVEETTRFYVDVLDLHPADLPRGDVRSAPQLTALADRAGTLVVITEAVDVPPGKVGIGTIHHVALAVASNDALLKWKRWLQQHQILVYGPYDQQAYQDIIFTDPDGVLIEIATLGPGWGATQDGQDLYSPPKETMAPFRDEEQIRARTWPHPVSQIEPDMVLQGFHHISTVVSSLPETNHFYRDRLGLSLVRKSLDHDDPEVEHWYWGLEGGQPGTVITAFPIVHAHEGGKPIHGQSGVGVVDHFALLVGAGEKSLPDWLLAPPSAGQADPGLPAHQAPSASVRTPDGLVVDLVTVPAHGALDRTPLGEDASPSSVQGGGPEGDAASAGESPAT